jgi:hypothetical protein
MGWVQASWIDQIITKTGRTVSRTPVTTTEDFKGEETLADGAAADITAVFLRKEQFINIDKHGELEEGDAYVIVADTQALLRNDKITVNSVVYRVGTVITFYGDTDNATAMYKYANLFMVS